MTDQTSSFSTFLEEQGEVPLRAKSTAGAVILSQLSFHELSILRDAVKRVYLKHYPAEFFTTREADRMIEALAPDVAERLIKNTVDQTLYDRRGRLAHGRLRLDE